MRLGLIASTRCGGAAWGHLITTRRCSTREGGSAAKPTASSSSSEVVDEAVYRTLFPEVALRAETRQRRRGPPVATLPSAPSNDALQQQQGDLAPHDDGSLATTPTMADAVAVDAANYEVANFMEAVEMQVQARRRAQNIHLAYPAHPDKLVPAFRRLKRHTAMTVVAPDPLDAPTFARKDAVVALPPAPRHPWLKRATPMGPHIVHGDGQIGMLGGTGEVGFDDAPTPPPRHWRGLHHRNIVGRRLPQSHGRVHQDAVVRRSFARTGRGVFATREIKKGEIIMIVQSTAQNVGVKGELRRLEQMCEHLLTAVFESVQRGESEMLDYLHDWILTGQPSSLLESWPAASTARVLRAVGDDVLAALELHELHIGRIAAIMDMNSMLVESYFAERKGMAYFPEAGFLNHSCVPNASYDVMPEHVFQESDYFVDECLEQIEQEEMDEVEGQQLASSSNTDATVEAEEVGPKNNNNKNNNSSAVATSSNGAADAEVSPLPSLTEDTAPTYLFCCRAEHNIAAGEEILISYVPPEWSFDNRQYVLHDRYRFWCKCPRCAPVLEKKYARIPKLVVVLVLASIFLQLLVMYQREVRSAAVADFNELHSMTAEERVEELRARGLIRPEDGIVEAEEYLHRQQSRDGVFERQKRREVEELYQRDGAVGSPDTSMHGWAAQTPR